MIIFARVLHTPRAAVGRKMAAMPAQQRVPQPLGLRAVVDGLRVRRDRTHGLLVGQVALGVAPSRGGAQGLEPL